MKKEIMDHIFGKLVGGVVDYAGRNDVDAMESLKRSMKRLRSQAMDTEDAVKKEEMSCKKKMKIEVKDWVKEVIDLNVECDDLETRVSNSKFPLVGDPVRKMQCRVDQLTEQRNNFNGLVLDDFDNDGVPCSPTKLFGNKIMETLKKIWPCLVVDNISSIGIWGMGGVGKTTLAKHIKHQLERENYRVYWVTVSQEFSVTSLQDKIANALGIPLSNRDEEHKRANILRAAFEKMEKSVFILDDVWEDVHLEDVGIAIAPNKCRLILTTRSLLVCDRMLCQRKFMVPTLDQDESWGLFKHTLGYATILSAEVEKIGKSVANRCAGLPLGIVTTAASMRGVTDIREWNSVLEQLKSPSDGGHQEMGDEVFPILEWSFNRLRGYEIPCFLYCCLYPEDYEIEREKLIDLFIYAELIPRRRTMALERDGGHTTLNKLIKVSLLQEAKNWRGDECVRMHDLIRDMALRITSGRCNSKNTQVVPRFLVKSIIRKSDQLVEKEEWKDDLAAVSLMASFFSYSYNILEIPPLMSPTSLSTLIINGANIREIPNSFLQHMCGLKVLNLESCEHLRWLPNCISDMVNLTALLLEGCSSLESVPPMGKLKKLRILNLRGTKVDDVPKGLEELVNLERLYMSGSLARALDLVGAPARARSFALELVGACALDRSRELASALWHERARALGLALGRALPRDHEDLLMRALELARAGAGAREDAGAPASVRGLARAEALTDALASLGAGARAGARARARAGARAGARARARAGARADARAGARAGARADARAGARAGARARAVARVEALTDALESLDASAGASARALARAGAGASAGAHARARERAIARDREFGVELAVAHEFDGLAFAHAIMIDNGLAGKRAAAPARALPNGTFSKLNRLQHLGLPAAVHISDLRVLKELQFFMGGLTYDQFLKSERWPTHYKIWVVDQNEFPGMYLDLFNDDYDVSDCCRRVGWENQLQFERCDFQKGLDVVWPLENLHRLDLYSCSGVSDDFFHRWMDRSKVLYHLRLFCLEELNFVFNWSSPVDEGLASKLEGALRTLRVIELWQIPNLVGLINIGRVSVGSLIPPGTFSSLEELHLSGCDGLKKLFPVRLVQQCLQNLKYLEVDYCRQLEEIVAVNDDLDTSGGEAIISQPSSSGGLIASTSQELLLLKVQCLYLSSLPKLENVCSPTTMIGGDERTTFVLSGCPKLKRLPSFSSTEIDYDIRGRKEWWNSLEWNNPSDKDAVQPFFKVEEDDEEGE